MRRSLRILHAEDNVPDAMLVARSMEEQGFQVEWVRVDTQPAYEEALRGSSFDLILSGFETPRFGGLMALRLARERAPEVPFIYVSRTIGEERAIEALHSGAVDYVLKDKLFRLGPAVERALRETALRLQRRIAEEQLHRAHQELQSVLAVSPAVIYRRARREDGGMETTFLSTNAEDLLGHPGALLRADWLSHVHPEDQEAVRAWLSEDAGRGLRTLEYRFRRGDGSWRWLADSVRETRGAAETSSGAVMQLVGSVVDITEHREMESRGRESEQKFRTLVDTIPDLVLLLDRDLRLLFANAPVAALFGARYDDLHPRLISEVVDPPAVARFLPRIQHAFRTGTPVSWQAEERIHGTPAWLDWTFVPVKDAAGFAASLLCIARDITRAKQAEIALKESEEKFRTLAEKSPSLILIIRGEAVLYVNERARDFLGRSPRHLLSGDVSWRTIFDAESARTVQAVLEGLERGEETVTFDGVMVRSDADPVHGVITASLVPWQGAGAVMFNAANATRLHALEAEKDRLKAQFQQAQKMEAIGQLAGGVAHDFNNILMVIMSYADYVLEMLREEDPARRMVQEIRAAGTRAADLTHQLLAFSRNQAAQPADLPVGERLAGLSGMIRRLVGERISCTIRCEADVDAVRCDPSQFDQVIINLVVNARDAMPEGGELTIAAEASSADGGPPGALVRISVRDTGTGIPEEILPKIFEPFFTTKPAGKGTGLGLSMVYGAVRQNYGTIAVESTPGKGSVFHISFRHVKGPADALAVSTRDPREELRGTRVLLVEDDEAVRKAVGSMLEDLGLTVTAAGSGEDALLPRADTNGGWDLLMTDVILPGIGGSELAERLRARHPGLRILFCTGYIDEINSIEKTPGAHVLSKPFDRPTLLDKLRVVLGSR